MAQWSLYRCERFGHLFEYDDDHIRARSHDPDELIETFSLFPDLHPPRPETMRHPRAPKGDPIYILETGAAIWWNDKTGHHVVVAPDGEITHDE